MPWLLLLTFCLLCGPAIGQPLSALHRADSDTVLYDPSLRTLVGLARTGDTLYLPGGFLDLGGDLTLGVPVHVVGAGFRTDTSDATGATVLTGGRLVLTSGATLGSLTGVWLRGRLQFGNDTADNEVSQYTITRCRFSDEVWLSSCPDNSCPSTAQTLLLAENVFDSHVRGADGLVNVALQNNFIGGSVWHFDMGAQLRLWSNVFLGRADTGACLRNVRGANANYNIFLGDSIADTSCADVSFRLNIFGGTFEAQGSLTESGSIEDQGTAETIFQAADNFDFRYEEGHNYRLIDGSPGAGADIFRRDLGAYGGRFPFKAGAKPFNPHVRTRDVAPYTETPNRLRIRIQVEAQDN